MTNPQGDAVYRVLLKADEKSKEEAVKALQKVTKMQDIFARSAEAGVISFERAAKEIKQMSIEQRRLEGVIASTEDAWRGAALALENYEEKLQSVGRSGQLFGDTAGTLGFGAGISNTLGASGVGAGFDIASQFADLGEQLPRLKVQLETFGEVARTAQGPLGKLVRGTGNLASSIPGVSSAMGSLLAVAGPVAIAVGLATFAIYKYNKGMEAQRKELEATLNAVSAVNQQIAEGLTSEDAEQRLAELRRSRDAEVQSLETARRAYDSMEQQLQGIGSGSGGAGDVVDFFVKLFDPREQQLFDTIQSAEASIAEMDTEIALLERNLQNGALAANDAAKSEAELAEERLNQIETLSQQLEQAREQSASLLEQEVEMFRDRANAARDAAEVEALEQEFALEDQLDQEREHRDELAKIAADGRARVEALEQEVGVAAAEALEELADIEARGSKELRSLESDYYEQRTKEFEDFALETRRIEEDTARERLRLVEDINARLRGAASSNDVIAFLEAQEEGAVELRRNAEDAQLAERRRVEDFVKAQEEAMQEFREQHQEVLAQIEEEKAAARQAAAERQADLAKQIEAEKQAVEQEIQNERRRFEESEANEARQAERQRRRDELSEMQEERAFQERLAAIRAEQAAWQQTFSIISSSLANLQAQAASGGGSSSKSGSFVSKGPSQSKPSSGSFGSFQAAAANYNERSRIERASGVQYSPTFNTNVGDIASRGEVTQALNDFASANAQELNNFIAGATRLSR